MVRLFYCQLAYINVSRTGIAYARSLPELQFLLVSTRRSGWISDRPANVAAEWLRSYASVRSRERKCEGQELMAQWVALRKELEDVSEFRTISECGYFNNFPYYFARGLEIRDAWRNVFDSEPVGAVLCADDSNTYTHIPLLLANKRGMRTHLVSSWCARWALYDQAASCGFSSLAKKARWKRTT